MRQTGSIELHCQTPDCKRMLHFFNIFQFQIPHPTQTRVKFSPPLAWVMVKCLWCSRADVDVLNWLAHYSRGQQKINPSDLMFRSERESVCYKFNIPTCADTRLIQTPHYYRQFALSLWKESPYIFYKFSVSVLTGLNCTTLNMYSVTSWHTGSSSFTVPERTIHTMYMDRSDAKLKY